MVMAITRLREVSGVTEAMVFTGNSRLVAFSSCAYGQLLPDLPPTSVINQLRVSRAYSAAKADEAPQERGEDEPACTGRSEERRGGKERDSTCRSPRPPYH